MNTAEFLSYLRDSGVRIWVEGDRLRCRAPNGMPLSDLRAGLVEHKEEILSFLRQARAAVGDTSQPILRIARGGELSLSFAQQRLWFLDRLTPNSAAYNILTNVRLSGRLFVSSFNQCLGEMVRRHETLRTRFVNREGKPAVIIDDPKPLTLCMIDLSGLDEDTRAGQQQRLTREVAARPFDLAEGSLLRVKLLKSTETEHLALLAMHHIISDGWSMQILCQGLTTLYKSFSQGGPARLPELSIQYVDYARWQRERLQGEALESELAYWKEELDGAESVLELPADRPRPLLQTFEGAIEYVPLSERLTAAIKALSRREGATVFMTLMGAFYVLLSRYTGKQDALIGTPIAGRDRRDAEEMIGLFVNTLVIRVRSSEEQNFRQLLSQVREVMLRAYAHQELPFEKLVDHLRPERNLSHTPLFQVMFVLHNAPKEQVDAPGLRFTRLLPDVHTAKFDLTLDFTESDERLGGAFEYNTDLFDRTTILRMLAHFEALLQAIVADPDQSLASLPLLPEYEQGQILVEWNDTAAEVPRPVCIHRLFEEQALRRPDATAVVFEQETLTYLQLDRRANQLAHYLRGLGVGPDRLVGISMERSPEMVVGLLGILKTGGAYVPLDPTYPKERIAYMLEDARLDVVLTQQRLTENLPGGHIRTLCLDADWQALAGMRSDNPRVESGVDNLAYVIYTSGSTGKPKGAMLPHLGVLNCLLWMQDTYRMDETDRFMLKTSLNFDPSVWEVFWTLSVGATIVIAPQASLLDRTGLARTIDLHKVTSVYFVPSMLRLFLEADGVETCKSLKRVICGGEALPPETVRLYWDRLDADFHHSYGPTEVSIAATETRCEPGTREKNVGIGRPLANTEAYVLDRSGHSSPIGVAGELFVGGLGVGRGYVNHPELTAERFVPDPLSVEPGSRLYRTGDMVRVLPDGRIEFLGRLDDQVKIRGFRIEPGEIEMALAQHHAVKEAVVLAREDAPGDKRLVAYVVAGGERAPTVTELRRFLQDRLPDYMVPSAFILMSALPTMLNGKLDRRALPSSAGARPTLDEDYVPPRTDLEQTIARVWQDLLHVDEIGAYDNYFDLGGNSLLMVEAHSKLVEVLNRDFLLVEMFMYPTIASLSEFLSGGAGEQRQAAQADEAERLNDSKNRLKLQLRQSRRVSYELEEVQNG